MEQIKCTTNENKHNNTQTDGTTCTGPTVRSRSVDTITKCCQQQSLRDTLHAINSQDNLGNPPLKGKLTILDFSGLRNNRVAVITAAGPYSPRAEGHLFAGNDQMFNWYFWKGLTLGYSKQDFLKLGSGGLRFC